ncbi:hypothetical protein B0H65DRAFT_423229 [Neurospora tetraspora]|uniref:Uncharacterized protein n=1 Tax=Neurospora tetraspora TaxID=94610 RepID=A0AAE0JHS8_9PEZI|nr:hypothetical protein B0H65DRAFT_423229 [Neurospora tetraspora]
MTNSATYPLSGFSMFAIRLIVCLSLGLIAAIVHIEVAIWAIATTIVKLFDAIAADLAHVRQEASTFGASVLEEKQCPKRDNTRRRKKVHFAEGTKPPMPDTRPEVVDKVTEWRAFRLEALSQTRHLLDTGRTLHARAQAFRLSEANRRAELGGKAGGRPRMSRDPRRVRSVSFRATRLGSLDPR